MCFERFHAGALALLAEGWDAVARWPLREEQLGGAYGLKVRTY